MKLWELFEDSATPLSIPQQLKRAEMALDLKYQPKDKLQTREPVLDVDLPSNMNNHFMQRLMQRKDVAGITVGDVYKMFLAAKNDPKFSPKFDALATQDNPHAEFELKNKDKVLMPVAIGSNPDCKTTQGGNPVCISKTGDRIPKNQITPKTIYKVGVGD